MELRVEIKITPPPSAAVTADELNAMIGGHLLKFEKWFMDKQRRGGNPNPSPLIGVEGGILQTYVMYLVSENKGKEE